MMDTRESGVPVKTRLSVRSLGGIFAVIAVMLVVSSGADARSGVDGAPSAGDRYFPKLGNSGYDVSHYDVALRIDPKRKTMRGTTTVDLEPTVALRSFTFDFIGFDVTSVQVDGKKARFSRKDEKLRITPANVLSKGTESVVRVSYKGRPDNPRKANGWLWFEGGGALFDPQPSGARTLFPCNDHPEDKASFSYDLITPRGVTAVANGLPTEMAAPDEDSRRVAWDEPERFPTYAAVVAVGKFELKRQTTPDGLEIIDALPAGDADRLEKRLKRQAEMVSYFESEFGPYPYSGMGAIVLPRSFPSAMEAAGRPTYPGVQWALKSDEFEQTVAHEIAHQWLGNSVTNSNWRDIWLNEGFATYAELMWIAHERDEPIGKVIRDRDVFTYPPKETSVVPGDPGPGKIFSNPVYNRGALTLEALRLKVGDEDFDEILDRWIIENRDANVTTKDFIRLSESVSGKDLDEFFRRWLYEEKRPSLPKSDG